MSEQKRVAISSSIRFEVFKRDSFKCQYCGRSAPDVILEVDHINPVSNGGDNDISNLVTSCFDCNRGKGKKLLSDHDIIEKQREQLEALNERREQLEMMLKWREELVKIDDEEVEIALGEINKLFNGKPTDTGNQKLKTWIKKFGLAEVLESITIAYNTYYKPGDNESSNYAFSKIGGICYNRKRQSNDPNYEWKQKLAYQASSRLPYVNMKYMYAYIFPSITKDNYYDFCDILHQSSSWTDFRLLCEDFIISMEM